jgi:UDP-N-acetylmuramate--alanine ligase
MTLPRNDPGDPSGPGHPSASDVAGWLGGEPRHIHLIGLAGTGISALAMILVELGHHVSGSDQRSAPVLDRLVEAGATAHVGHDPGHVEGADLVICSTAIRADHPERVAATSAGLPVLTRADALAGLTRLRPSIAVSGTHGKTTSTAMMALALRSAGARVSWLVGSTVPALETAASWGDGEWFVVEADESDDTHLALARAAVLLTNAEGEHLDFHGTLGRVIDGYVEFLEGAGATDPDEAPSGGPARPVRVAGADDPGAALVGRAVEGVVTFGTASDADWRLEVLGRSVTGTTSTLTSPSGEVIPLSVSVPGDHNATNAAGVVALAGELGFRSVSRRRRGGRLHRYRSSVRASGRRQGRELHRRLCPPSDRGGGHFGRSLRVGGRACGRRVPASPVQPHPAPGRPLRRSAGRGRRRRRHRRVRRPGGPDRGGGRHVDLGGGQAPRRS